ncbi:Pimeloyl-ACP methyl ester carboxylesterase [Brevibacterium sandarakinum]|uniref:Pimeloyl-ACP methyl ester carboxylesterase n=1 Tax=Brevibacterium sandarakinum TaxID=629680 RepID=A0A1H1XD14_BRESA|nr:alpha/beta hydrolase [Brevibacterium sandarakinum]SDT07177.1 Pimeloyl-ACP methyl ester carboxylesterase [Brevibacterium sandarakinum]
MLHSAKTRHRQREVDGLQVHYRESGVPSSTAVVLLHGAPSSSYSFREVLPVVGEYAYVVAPDIPGFGFSDAPTVEDYEYTYEQLSRVVDSLLDDLGVERYVLFVTDYSTPVGYFMATRRPERVLGLVVQNGNAHEAGLGQGWDSARRFWAEPTEENRAALPDWLTFEGTRDTYLAGVPDEVAQLHPPESWHLDWQRLSRPGTTEVYFQFFYDYRNHVARFGEIADYHAEHQPPCMVLWGRHDPAFDIAEVLAYHQALTTFEAHIYDAGHFLLETHAAEVADLLVTFTRDAFDRAGVRS